jgi:glycosyltransferase involved in cell wall biosynthesis
MREKRQHYRGRPAMRIAYATDHVLPRTATDAEQLMATVAAFGESGAAVDLLVPAHPWRPAPNAAALAEFYEVAPSFTVTTLRGAMPTFRGLEKVAHGFAVARSSQAAAADVLYTRNLPTVLASLRRGSTPVVYETYRPWPDQQPRRAPLFRWIFEHPRFLGAVLHSDLAAASYRRIGARDEQLLVAHNGYDPQRLTPVLSRAAAREQMGLPLDRSTVVYAGHISLDKGLGLVLDLAEALPTVQFVLVGSKGDGPVEQRAAAMENVAIVPWQPFSATVPYLYAADVLLIPPTRGPLESVGNTVLPMKTFLYMAAGRAIFAPATPDLTEVLTDNVSARLVPPDDLKTAVAALRDLLADESFRVRLAAAARADVQTWQARAERVLSFLATRLSAEVA